MQPFKPIEAELLLESKMLKEYWNIAITRNLLEVLEYIPLAIIQVVAYMRQNRIFIEKYIKSLG